jgi:hypothetical protein
METITLEPGSKRLDVRDVPDLRISQTVGPISFLDTTKSKLYCDARTLHKLSPSYSNCIAISAMSGTGCGLSIRSPSEGW